MKVIIAGSREIVDRTAIESLVKMAIMMGATEIVHGGASGVDSIAGGIAKLNGINVRIFPADWAELGKKAGPIRNKQMAEYADVLIAVMPPYGTKGTADMIRQMKAMGKQVVEFMFSDGEAVKMPDYDRAWEEENGSPERF